MGRGEEEGGGGVEAEESQVEPDAGGDGVDEAMVGEEVSAGQDE